MRLSRVDYFGNARRTTDRKTASSAEKDRTGGRKYAAANLNFDRIVKKEQGRIICSLLPIAFTDLIAGFGAPINTYQFVTKNVSIYGIETGSRQMFEKMNRFIERHHIKPVIDSRFAFDEVRAALKYLESGAHFGKVVIEF